jgi:hypothetical protein
MASGIVPSITNSLDTFTDFDLLPNQLGTMNFGPVTGSESIQYRTWAAFTSGGSPQKAYAVTNGEVFIQELPANPTLVNLILKPDVQPNIQYGHVRYFVYRGLMKSSFLDSTGNVIVASPSNSELISRMWAVRNNLNSPTNANTPGVVLVRGDLGLDPTFPPTTPDSTLIDDTFNLLVFQRVSQGMYIGDFDTTISYGFEIIVEGNNYQPVLGDVRVLDHIITINYQSGQNKFSNGQAEDISIKLMREQILSYIDPAAYFGLLSNNQLVIHNSPGGGGNITVNTPSDIYTKIISKFATNGNVYIDLRDELNNSLNYFGTYSDTNPTKTATIQFKNATSSFTPKSYTNNGWPILVLTNSTDFSPVIPGSIATASFMLPAGDNIYPIIYLSGASFLTDSLNYVQKFQILTLSSSFTSEFDLSIANNAGIAVFPFAIKLSYARRYDISNLLPVPPTLARIWKDDYPDNLLSPIDINITTNPNDPTFQNSVVWNTNNDLKYIGWLSIKAGRDYTVRSGIAKDSIGEVVYAFFQGPTELAGAISIIQTHTNVLMEINKKSSKSFFLAIRDILKGIRILPFTLASSINTIQIDSITNQYSVINQDESYDDLLSMAYTPSEKTTILNSINQFLTGSDCYYVALNHNLTNDSNNVPYFVFDLGVQGIIFSGSPNFTYTIERLNTGIQLYSLDGKSYFTQAYANALNPLI